MICVSISEGAAPGWLTKTETNGVDRSGLSVIGRRMNETTPNTSSTANSTSGNIGCVIAQAEMRLMKFSGTRESSGPRGSRDLHALAGAQECAGNGDDAFAARQTRVDQQSFRASPCDADVPPLKLVLGIDHQYIVALVVAEHRSLRQQDAGHAFHVDAGTGKRTGAQIPLLGRQRDAHRTQPRI